MEDYPSLVKGAVLKTVRRVKACGGSNPSSSVSCKRNLFFLGDYTALGLYFYKDKGYRLDGKANPNAQGRK